MISKARVRTDHASRYLQQLCKHWGHRFTVEFDPAHGIVRFETAQCQFDASEGHLDLTLDAADDAMLDQMEGVVANHLQRFAFREELSFAWVRGPDGPAAPRQT